MNAIAERPIVEVLSPRAYPSKRAVVETIGNAMIAATAVTAAYVDGMFRKELEGGTLVTDGVALPHGTPDVRSAVLRNILVVAPVVGGVEWVAGRQVRVAIGFAGTGDAAHLRLLGSVARVLADDALLERLKSGSEPARLAELFAEEQR